ncbi:universal stress protein [Halorubrum sp. SD626R]|uniref:universal stress protein n=1 Tax=Halorubrum sp. SD626R TaxID=1419722 RepID=UPI000A716390|nr:universal stress protein [Halorubrum sp. SD626R]TKX81875.1 universal stress protein [Halorubrum sp. SD626R]
MALDTLLLAVGPEESDSSDRLARTTVDIAGPSGATVVLLHPFTQEEYESTIDNLGIRDASEVTVDDVARRHGTIRSISRLFEEEGIDYEIRGAIGTHADEIVRLATETESGLVIVGGRGRSPTGKALFGSTAQQVILAAPCPVTLVRSDLDDRS